MIEVTAKCGHRVVIDDDRIRKIKSKRTRKEGWQPQFCLDCRDDFFTYKEFEKCEAHDYQCQHD